MLHRPGWSQLWMFVAHFSKLYIFKEPLVNNGLLNDGNIEDIGQNRLPIPELVFEIPVVASHILHPVTVDRYS